MAGSSRRKSTQKSGISYAEVDSDVDMQEDQKQVQASKAKSAKEKARKPKKRARTVDTEGEQVTAAPQQSLEGFLELPLDVLSEVCSHLDPADLIKLSRTSKLFRSLLLSRDSRHIWLAARRAAKLPEIKDLDELNYALLLHGSSCSNCGETSSSVDRDYALRLKLCDPCKKELLTFENKVKKVAGGPVHARTLLCVPASSLKTPGRRQRWMTFYLTSDVLEVNRALLDLQEDDEIAQDAWTSHRLSTGTRTRKAKQVVEAPESLVDAFVQEKRAEAAARVDERTSITNRLQRNAAEERDRIRNEQEAVWNELKLDLEVNEWFDDQIEWYKLNVHQTHTGKWISPIDQALVRPLGSMPSTHPEDWKGMQEMVQARLAQEERDRSARVARQEAQRRQLARTNALRPYFKRLLNAQKTEHDTRTFPPFNDFKQLQTVKPLWEPEGDEVDDKAWSAVVKKVNSEVKQFREKRRVETIRIILSATNNVPLSSLSTDPADYDEAEYDEGFFNKVTSHFYQQPDQLKPYPDAFLRTMPYYPFGFGGSRPDWGLSLENCISNRQVRALRAILKVAKLDEDTATLDDLEDLGRNLQWPSSKSPLRDYTAEGLIGEITNRFRRKDPPKFDFTLRKIEPQKSKKSKVRSAEYADSGDSSEEDVKPVLPSDDLLDMLDTRDDDSDLPASRRKRDLDSASSSEESDRPRVKKARPVKVKNMSDSDGEDDMDLGDEMDEQGSSLATE